MLLAEIQITIARVKKMEQYLDEILAELCIEEGSVIGISGDVELVRHHIEKLSGYYDSGLWLHDYECDERGELPSDLKRGVLSQDTLYNLLADISERNEIYKSFTS